MPSAAVPRGADGALPSSRVDRRMAAPRVLILSASIGEGHDLPARVLADGLARECPDVWVRIEDGLAVMGWPLTRIAEVGSRFDSRTGDVMFDVEYVFLSRLAPTRWLAGRLLELIGGRGLLALIARERPDVVVATYPGVSEVLGRLRRRGRLDVPVVSAITDLAALRFWAHPGVDLHLVTHPESIDEVRSIAPSSRIVCTSGLTSPDFLVPRARAVARRALGLPLEGAVIAISGGGWAVGDLQGAASVALGVDGARVVCLCGRNEGVRQRLEATFAREPRLVVVGFTDQMSDWLAAADVLIHSTAGLTVLEAIIRGCAVISYGWGRGHIRANNRAYTRFGLAEVVASRSELSGALRRALERRPEPDLAFAELTTAARAVLREAAR
jgi:processive 1,2-diacylglycerol beta-glucosyltransferase